EVAILHKMTFVDEQLDDILEKVLEESGGLGKLQWLLIFVINGSRLAITWGIFMMTFAGSTPDWWCVSQNGTSGLNDDRLESLRSCSPLVNTPGGYSCLSIRFSKEKNTIVNEWSLICWKEWITSIITTMQFVGLLTSGFIAGQVADLIGRKPTLLLSLTLLAASNLLCAFSSSWEMFAIARFLIGLACGMFLTVYLNFVLEFIPTTYRAMIMAIDTCPINAALLGLVSFWLKDWRYLHFATFLITLPFLLGMIMVPESFRWLVSHFKTEKAKEVIEKIAIINGKERTDVTKLIAIIQKETEEVVKKSYSILDIFRDTTLTKHSFLLWFIWLSTGYSYFAISFGVEELSGDLYLNIILLSLVEIPVQLVTWYLNNSIGRRWTFFMFYMIAFCF
ncbi:solute carrier family 22 member 4-like, partial [Saccostrea cucullata]|uniref:solute carrier family 22 member 4-like n=1 Tax=Saccostrea cuccullata TaxID=36930 RepID=UPI002ED49497